MNIRRFFRGKSDRELAETYRRTSVTFRENLDYLNRGGVDQESARLYCDARLINTVVRAVARERTPDGRGHLELRYAGIVETGKRRSRFFGDFLRRKRGVER